MPGWTLLVADAFIVLAVFLIYKFLRIGVRKSTMRQSK
jgi:hypothetical protein